jgi:glycosyltransferase involved in cell wall biosynthesis
MRKKFGIKEDSKLVVSLGRLTRQTGFDLLIKAFRRVVKDVPNAVLLIGGDGDEKERLNALVASASLGMSVMLPGLINDIDELLMECDLYVNSSRWEGLPMTLLEVLSHGKPIVASNVGGNPEVVHDGVTGILVLPEDPDKLANAIVRMLNDDKLRKKAGEAAFQLFKRNYSIEKHCKALADFYLQV